MIISLFYRSEKHAMITIGKCDARPDARLGAKRNHQSRAKKKKKIVIMVLLSF